MIEFIGGFKKGVENVVHNGYDYGRPIFLGNQVWLDKNVGKFDKKHDLTMCNGPGEAGQNDVKFCSKFIPKGWRLPVK